MEKAEKDQLTKALTVIKAARLIPHVFSNMAYNSHEYEAAIETLVVLLGDEHIKEKAQKHAVKWDQRLKAKSGKDSKGSTPKKNGNSTALKVAGGCLAALLAIGTVGAVGYRAGKKKTGE